MRRVFAWLLGHRLATLGIAVALTGVLGAFASRVRPDYSVEHLFPVHDPARDVYDRFKSHFPYEDGRAFVIVEAPDLFTKEGLARLARLEHDLAAIPNVVDVEGPMSQNDIVPVDDWAQVERLFPSSDLSDEEIARRRRVATTDPLFSWNLAKPDGSAVTIRVTLSQKVAATDEGRQAFVAAAEKVIVSHHRPGQKIVLSGIPAIRAQFARLIAADTATLLPAALLVVLLLLCAAFRSVGLVLSGMVTIVAALVWSYGVMGLVGYPITTLGSVMPIVVVIISISDSVHIISDFTRRRRAGEEKRAALVAAMADTAMPCLSTEVVLACGFLSLVLVNIVAVYQFGVATAAAMLLTWLANMIVLPLALSLSRDRAPTRTAPWAVRRFERLVDGIAALVTGRPRRVALVALVVLATAAAAGTRVRKQAWAFDDLRPESRLYRDLRFAEATHGGLVPVAIYVEALPEEKRENPVLDPEVVRLLDRAATFLESFPEIQQAASVADPLRKTHRILAGGESSAENDGLPSTRSLVAQELSVFDDGRMLRDYVSFDRRAAAALGHSVDAGSSRAAEMFREIDAWVAREQARIDAIPGAPRVKIHATGQLRIFHDVNEMLLEGLLGSFGGALAVTVAVFCVVLRSVRLGLIGIVPNLAPIVMVFGLMGLVGITLKPSTVILFSITLVIADDDTMQYLARFRRHLARARRRGADAGGGAASPDVYREAALGCLREVGLPMFVTSTAVSLGFLLLCFSKFLGAAHLGFLVGVTLFSAVFADLFLTPLLLMTLRPKVATDADPDDEEGGSPAERRRAA